jgi:hypothetical protein
MAKPYNHITIQPSNHPIFSLFLRLNQPLQTLMLKMKRFSAIGAAILISGFVWSSCGGGDKKPDSTEPVTEQPQSMESAPVTVDSAAIKMQETTKKVEENTESLKKALDDL